MGKRINPRNKIVQRSIGFNFRQIEFFNSQPTFKPDEYCRRVIDEQIALIDPTFLTKEEPTDEKSTDERGSDSN